MIRMNLFKKIISLFVIVAIGLGTTSSIHWNTPSVRAEEQVSIFLDGQQLSFSQDGALIKEGRVFLPYRDLAEQLGAHVNWIPTEKKVQMNREEENVEMTVGLKQYKHNGKLQEMDTNPFIYQARVYVPIRFIAHSLSLELIWQAEEKNVLLFTSKDSLQQTMQSKSPVAEYSNDDLYWLAKIIYTESRGEPFEGQVAVGAVILNRVKNESFPDTIYDVIFDKQGGYIQFEPVLNGEIYRQEPDQTAYDAARKALEGEDPTGGKIYFFNPAISSNGWMFQRQQEQVTQQIGTHIFMR